MVFVVVDPSACLLSGCALQKVWSDMECHHPAGEGEDKGDDLLNLVDLEATNPKVEEKAHLVINCAGNEGDSVEKMAGNVPKVRGNVPKVGYFGSNDIEFKIISPTLSSLSPVQCKAWQGRVYCV